VVRGQVLRGTAAVPMHACMHGGLHALLLALTLVRPHACTSASTHLAPIPPHVVGAAARGGGPVLAPHEREPRLLLVGLGQRQGVGVTHARGSHAALSVDGRTST